MDTTTNIRGSAKRIAAFTLQHGTMLTPRRLKAAFRWYQMRPCHLAQSKGGLKISSAFAILARK